MTDCNVERRYELARWLRAWLLDKAEDFRPSTIKKFQTIAELLSMPARISPCTDEDVARVAKAIECRFYEAVDSADLRGPQAFEAVARAAISAMNQIRSTDHD